MTRPPSSDEPTREARSRMMRTRWRRTAGLYVASDGAHSVASYVDPNITIPLGSREVVTSEPEKDLWAIERGGAEEQPEYLTYRAWNADFSAEGLATVEVRSTGVGQAPVFGPPIEGGQFDYRIAVAADGSYMVAVISMESPGEVGLFPWDDALKCWADTPVDTLSFDFVANVAISANGDVAVAGADSGSYIFAYPSSIAGFGAPYSAPGAGLPAGDTAHAEWHPSGNGLLVGGDNNSPVWGWQFTTGVGFGSPYAPYDISQSKIFGGVATAESIRFSPSGDFVLVGTDAPKVPDAALFYEVWNFDVVSGWGDRVPDPDPYPPVEEQYGDDAGEQYSVVSDTHVYTVADVVGETSSVGVWTHPYDAGGIGDGALSPPSTPVYAFAEHALLLSRTGRFLAFWADSTYSVFVYFVASDGSLTPVGSVFNNYNNSAAALGWR